MADENKWFLPEETRKYLTKTFEQLVNPVTLEIFIKDGQNDTFNNLAVVFSSDIARLSDKISVNVHQIGDEISKKYNVTRSPTVLINPEEYSIRYTGAPIGEEGKSFIEAIVMVSTKDSRMKPESRKMMEGLTEKKHIMVFVTPQCPYCPMQVLNGFKAAIERPDIVSAECVESAENQDLAERYNVSAVPQTIINDNTASTGMQPEESFMKDLIGNISGAPAPRIVKRKKGSSQKVDLIIVGAGPAGLTAGIYAQRSGLKSVILEKEVVGGQVALTPVVENYPGFANIPGKKLIDIIAAHASDYVDIREGEDVTKVRKHKDHIEVLTNEGKYMGKALVIGTGAQHRKLGVPGEKRLAGLGVSYCATCDGYLFRGKKLLMVGGGNSALTDALYLKNLGIDVTIVHRRDEFRAQQYLQEAIEKAGIPVLWNFVVEKIIGKTKVAAVELKNTKDGTFKNMEVDGVFIAIGWIPNVDLAVALGVELDEDGFIKVDNRMRTNVPQVYAAGDVNGGVRQIVTAISEGATAALTSFEDLAQPYWLNQ